METLLNQEGTYLNEDVTYVPKNIILGLLGFV